MHSLSCHDLGNPTCPFVASDETVEGTVGKMMDHTKDQHAADIEKMLETMTPDELTELLKSKVKTSESM